MQRAVASPDFSEDRMWSHRLEMLQLPVGWESSPKVRPLKGIGSRKQGRARDKKEVEASLLRTCGTWPDRSRCGENVRKWKGGGGGAGGEGPNSTPAPRR